MISTLSLFIVFSLFFSYSFCFWHGYDFGYKCKNPSKEIKAQLIIGLTLDNILDLGDICNIADHLHWKEYVDCGEWEWAGVTCESTVNETDHITQSQCCGYNAAVLFQFRSLHRAQLLVSGYQFQQWMDDLMSLRREGSPEPLVGIYDAHPALGETCYRDTDPSRNPKGADRCSGNYRQHISFHLVEPTEAGRQNALEEATTYCGMPYNTSSFNHDTVQELIHGNFTDLDDLTENYDAPFGLGRVETLSTGFWEPLDVFVKSSDWIAPLAESGLLGGPDTACHGEILSQRVVNYCSCA